PRSRQHRRIPSKYIRTYRMMSESIAPLTRTQGFSAKLVTGLSLSLPADWAFRSRRRTFFRLLFGIGIATGHVNKRSLTQFLFAWLLTAPAAAVFAVVLYRSLA